MPPKTGNRDRVLNDDATLRNCKRPNRSVKLSELVTALSAFSTAFPPRECWPHEGRGYYRARWPTAVALMRECIRHRPVHQQGFLTSLLRACMMPREFSVNEEPRCTNFSQRMKSYTSPNIAWPSLASSPWLFCRKHR